jgi:Trk K+ transport system NAD-binding subunit
MDDADFTHVAITPGAAAEGRLISELELPEGSLIVSVHRGNQLIIPHGYTRLRAKDQLTIFADAECLPVAEQQLTGRRKI